jgi:hypothetical protein
LCFSHWLALSLSLSLSLSVSQGHTERVREVKYILTSVGRVSTFELTSWCW